MKYLRVSGIYDQQTIHLLKEIGVKKFTFDFRPTSLNFIQTFKVSEIINQTYQYGDEYSVEFSNDKDFVISSVLERIATGSNASFESLNIEFTTSRKLDECEYYDRPFIWHYDESNANTFLASKYLHTVIFNQQLIQQLNLKQQLYPFMGEFFKRCPQHINVELEMDWTGPITSTLLDFFPINGLKYSINSMVESSFRNVDLHLVRQHIEQTILKF